MVPLVVVAIGCKLNELSGLGDAVDGRPRAGMEELLRLPIFRFRSSRRSDLRGDTLIRLVRLLDVADWNWILLFDSAGAAAKLRAVVRFTGPLLLCEGSSVPLPGSCFIGISEMDGVMVVATSSSDMVRTEPFPPLLAPPTV